MTKIMTSNNGSSISVTIGMPVYNVERYIKASLLSALEQDFGNIEILIVDDCGTDSSMKIIQLLKDSHPKGDSIRIVHHESNKGVGAARNTILHEARGKYILFLDSDDILAPTAISTLYKAAEEEKAEVTYGSAKVRETDGKVYNYFTLPRRVLSGKDALVNYIYGDISQNIPYYVWNILFLNSFIRDNNLVFPSFKAGEDVLFNELLQPKVTKAVLLPDVTYLYLKRPNSLMRFQYREIIGIEEARNSIRYSEMQKEICQELRNRPYYAGKCAKTMKEVFYRVCGILKHRHQLTGKIDNRDLRDMMRHPAPLKDILSFKQQKMINILFWSLGKLPPGISISIIKIIGKKKGYIK